MRKQFAVMLAVAALSPAAALRAETQEAAKAGQEGALAVSAEQLSQAARSAKKSLAASAKRRKKIPGALPVDRQVMEDAGTAKLAQMLKGRKLLCGPVDEAAAKTEEKGFFPITLTAKDLGAGKTRLAVAASDPRQTFGFGGDDFDPVEVSDSWVIVSCGDDGRRVLFLNASQGDDLQDPDYRCDTDRNGNLSGELPGLVSEVWDAGTISSRGVQCCLK